MRADMTSDQDEYRQEVMLTCKILLDSLKEGKRFELPELVSQRKKKLQFVARIVKLGDTFESDSTQPIYGLSFTTESEHYLMRTANQLGLKSKSKVLITIEPVDEGVQSGAE
jgi:hypothetical protein